MKMKQLGRLEKINPREIWADEARDFTPWLRENIRALSEALGLDLEITESEGAVGDFWVDLVGRDLSSGRPVVIENQLGSDARPTGRNREGDGAAALLGGVAQGEKDSGLYRGKDRRSTGASWPTAGLGGRGIGPVCEGIFSEVFYELR
ncbi:MAG: hypothetical protein AB1426_07200 [Bacillota bacterium]